MKSLALLCLITGLLVLSGCASSTNDDAITVPDEFDEKLEPTMGIEEFDRQAKFIIDNLDADVAPRDIEVEVNGE